MTLTNYWWFIIWLFVGGGICKFAIPSQVELVSGKKEERTNWIAVLIIVLPFILWAGFRGDFVDTGAYRKTFMEAPRLVSEWGTFIASMTKDKGFFGLMLPIKSIIGDSSQGYFLIIALIEILCVASLFRKYSCDFWLSFFIFIASTEYLSWTWNGIRQFMAVSIIIVSSDWIFEKKYLRAICAILLASTMHQSALLMIPMIFIIQGKAWNKKSIICVVGVVIALAYVGQFTDLLERALTDTQYTNVVSDWKSWNDDGTNPFRVLVYSIPTILSVAGYRYIKNEDDHVINICVNASIMSLALYLLSMRTSGIFIGRLPIYVSLYSMQILLPWEIHNFFTEQSVHIVKIVTIISFLIFFYYQMHIAWGIL